MFNKCSDSCIEVLDDSDIKYHILYPAKPTNLINLGLGNGVSLDEIFETIDSALTFSGDGLLTKTDTDALQVSLSGFNNRTISADLKLAQNTGNTAVLVEDGLFVPVPENLYKVQIDEGHIPYYLQDALIGDTDGVVSLSFLPTNSMLLSVLSVNVGSAVQNIINNKGLITNLTSGVLNDITHDSKIASYLTNAITNAILNDADFIKNLTDAMANTPDAFDLLCAALSGCITSYAWVPDQTVCQQDGLLSLVANYNNFSSPSKLFYNTGNGLMYLVDIDDVHGNIMWFDPTTFTGYSSVTHSTKVNQVLYDNSSVIDPVTKRIYLAGQNTNGLIVYDIATDSILSTIAYGANSPFNRLNIFLINGKIYASSDTGPSISVIDTVTLGPAVTKNVSALAGSPVLNGSYSVLGVDNNIWITQSGGSASSNVYVYDQTLTTLIATISLPGSAIIPTAHAGSNLFWGNSFYDADNDYVYINDIGSSNLYIIKGSTKTIAKTITFNNRQGNNYAQTAISISNTTGAMYVSYSEINNVGDNSLHVRSYKFDRVNLNFIGLFNGLNTAGLTEEVGTSFLWSVQRNLAYWNSPNTGWNTDGVITKLTY